ncbi:Thioredoxin-like protein YtpP [Diplonema papillatum]|nr:Thioredoxin-like protein YtpP [Diplonema papillatum]
MGTALRQLDANVTSTGSVKRKREHPVECSEKKPRAARRQPAVDLEATRSFLSRNGRCAVVLTAGWDAAKSARAAALAEKLGARVPVLRLSADEDDESGEICHELGFSAAPAVFVFDRSSVVAQESAFAAPTDALFASLSKTLPAPGSSPAAPASSITSIQSVAQFHELSKRDSYTVFNFSASWCPPCQRIAPKLPDLIAAFPKASFFKVDRDAYLDLHQASGVAKIPTFQVYKNGEKLGSLQNSDSDLVREFLTESMTSLSFTLDSDDEDEPAAKDEPVPMQVDASPAAPAFRDLESTEQFDRLSKGSSYTVFDFSATWCAPCQRIAPRLPELAAAYPEASFIKVDRDRFLDLHKACGVPKIPTFQVYKEGAKIASLQHSDYDKVHAFLDSTMNPISFDDDF